MPAQSDDCAFRRLRVDSTASVKTAQEIIRRLDPGHSFTINERMLKSAAKQILAKNPGDTTSVLVPLAQLKGQVLLPQRLSAFLLKITGTEKTEIPSSKPHTSDVLVVDRFLTELYRKEINQYNKLQGQGPALGLAHEHLKLAYEAASARRKYFQGLKAQGMSWKIDQMDMVDYCRTKEKNLLRLMNHEFQRMHLAQYQSFMSNPPNPPRRSGWGSLLAPFRFLFR